MRKAEQQRRLALRATLLQAAAAYLSCAAAALPPPAAAAGRRATGASPAPYNYLPFFYSREFSLSWQFWGSTDDAAETVVWGAADGAAAAAAAVPGGPPAKFGAFWLQGGRLVGAFLEGGSTEEAAALKALVTARAAAPSVDELRAAGAGWALAAAARL